ncbi:hypothetical protein LXA43DRAFT_1178917 [Ganoderma leucocontextum]|nr:hypothetical protein LXA43DRAFT_1178917 [Ganoderma leucocontextum]
MLLYYHVSDAEKEQMFPTDPHLADPARTDSVHSRGNTSTSSVACEAFHHNLQKRDTRCVAIGWDEMYCDAAHLTLTFLPIPNFAMDSSDAVPGAHPSERMYIVHPFVPLKSYHIAGSRLAMPNESPDQCPPPILFEAVYGAVVLHEFGVQSARARVGEVWEDLYYPRGGFDATTAEIDVGRRRAPALRREYLAVPPDELRRYFADVEKKAEQEERSRAQTTNVSDRKPAAPFVRSGLRKSVSRTSVSEHLRKVMASSAGRAYDPSHLGRDGGRFFRSRRPDGLVVTCYATSEGLEGEEDGEPYRELQKLPVEESDLRDAVTRWDAKLKSQGVSKPILSVGRHEIKLTAL